MRLGGNSILVLLLICLLSCSTFAEDAPAGAPALPADSLVMKAAKAQLWDQGDTSVAELTGPVHIELDHAKMSAENAVVWLSPNPDGPPDSHRVQIVLIGRAQLQQEGVLRIDQRLLVKATITGDIQLAGRSRDGR